MGSPRICYKKYPFIIKSFLRIVKNGNFHYLEDIFFPFFGPLMMFDMYVTMIFGLSIGALTFYCYHKAFGDPTLAWERRNQAYRTCKKSSSNLVNK
jgi:hypothetical protein